MTLKHPQFNDWSYIEILLNRGGKNLNEGVDEQKWMILWKLLLKRAEINPYQKNKTARPILGLHANLLL